MNRQMKLLILGLLTAILILTSAIVSLAMQGKKNNASIPETGGSNGAVSLYIENGLWGIRTNSGRQITEPKWSNLRVMNDTMLIAKSGAGDTRRYGIIDNKGDTLVPPVYSDFNTLGDLELWVATLAGTEPPQYHLYNTAGQLCSMVAWDRCSVDGTTISLAQGSSRITAEYAPDGLRLCSHYSEHSVGLRKLTVNLNRSALEKLYTPQTATALGNAAANYLSYLFVTSDTPLDNAVIGSENPSSLLVSSRYNGYRLQSAVIKHIVLLQNEGLPAYRLQIQVRYSPITAGNDASRAISTAMLLTVAQNANGDFVYTAFSDMQADLSAAAHTQNLAAPAALTSSSQSPKKGFFAP